MTSIDDAALRVAMARRIMARESCDTGIAQHVSERDESDRVWVSPLEFGECRRPENVCAFDLHGVPIDLNAEQAANCTSDYVEIYRRHLNVRAVLHSHSFWAMVLCSRERARGGAEMSDQYWEWTKAGHDQVYVELSWSAHVRRLHHMEPDLFVPSR